VNRCADGGALPGQYGDAGIGGHVEHYGRGIAAGLKIGDYGVNNDSLWQKGNLNMAPINMGYLVVGPAGNADAVLPVHGRRLRE